MFSEVSVRLWEGVSCPGSALCVCGGGTSRPGPELGGGRVPVPGNPPPAAPLPDQVWSGMVWMGKGNCGRYCLVSGDVNERLSCCLNDLAPT